MLTVLKPTLRGVSLIANRRRIVGPLLAVWRRCRRRSIPSAEHHIVSDVEAVLIQAVNDAYARLLADKAVAEKRCEISLHHRCNLVKTAHPTGCELSGSRGE